jgi:hypothetical protein
MKLTEIEFRMYLALAAAIYNGDTSDKKQHDFARAKSVIRRQTVYLNQITKNPAVSTSIAR